MELSVVVSTLNNRARLLSCLDALRDQLPSSAEVIVVNGPSSDGTTGAVRERDDVDVLVEISDRSRTVSRNAGFEVVSGDTVAFLGDTYTVEGSWYDAVESAMNAGSDVVTGPVRGGSESGDDRKTPRTIGGRSITYFDGDNVAIDRTVLEALDGFDEYLTSSSARDCAHRVAALGFDVIWSAEMAVRDDVGTDGGHADPDWGGVYRSLSYRLAKNYGPRPGVVGRAVGSAVGTNVGNARDILAGETTPTTWLRDGADITANILRGLKDGVYARYVDNTDRRNPNGVSARHDRAVQLYDRR